MKQPKAELVNGTSSTYTVRYCESWEMVDHLKVNEWMRSLGATWQHHYGLNKDHGRWLMDDMYISQDTAAKWYVAVHKRKWWRFWR